MRCAQGFDFMVDSAGAVSLLEINTSPALFRHGRCAMTSSARHPATRDNDDDKDSKLFLLARAAILLTPYAHRPQGPHRALPGADGGAVSEGGGPALPAAPGRRSAGAAVKIPACAGGRGRAWGAAEVSVEWGPGGDEGLGGGRASWGGAIVHSRAERKKWGVGGSGGEAKSRQGGCASWGG